MPCFVARNETSLDARSEEVTDAICTTVCRHPGAGTRPMGYGRCSPLFGSCGTRFERKPALSLNQTAAPSHTVPLVTDRTS
jgi:hypothetical protein